MKSILSTISMILVSGFCFAQNGWQHLPNAPDYTAQMYRIDDIYFINDSTGWAACSHGEIYKTSDYGNSWTLQLDTAGFLRSIEFINDSTGFAGTLDTAVYKTTDAGATWTRIDQLFPPPVYGVCGIGHHGINIIMTGIVNAPAYLLRSSDGGVTWTYMDMSSFASALIDCWYKTADTVFVSGYGLNSNKGVVLRSDNGGITWQQVTQATTVGSCCWKMQFTSQSIGYCSLFEPLGNITHFLKTTDGGASYQYVTGFNPNIKMEGLGFINDTVGWVGGYSTGMYETTDGGSTWNYLNIGNYINRYFMLNDTLGYASGFSIYKFTGGATPSSVNPLHENENIHSLEVFPNPSNDRTTVKLTIGRNTMAVLDLFDAGGNFVMQLERKRLAKGAYTYELNANNFPAGSYILALRTFEHSVSKPVLFNRD